MSKKTTPDNQFQKFIKKFHHVFGIQRQEDVQTQEHKLLASSVQLKESHIKTQPSPPTPLPIMGEGSTFDMFFSPLSYYWERGWG